MQGSKGKLFGRCIALCGLTTVLGVAALFVLHGAQRAGAATGLAVGVLATASALAALAVAIDRNLKFLLGAIAVGFLLRMLLVAGGLLIAIAFHADLMAFSIAFFGLFLAHQTIELRVVVRRARPMAAEGRT